MAPLTLVSSRLKQTFIFQPTTSPVVIHDPTLDRTTLGSGVVHDYDWQTLQSIELKNTGGECVPHLNDLLALLKPTGIVLRLELKADYNRLEYNSLVEIATDALRSAQMLERTIFTSFTWSYLSTIRSIVPNAPLIGLINAPRLAELGGVNGAIQLAKEQDVPEIAFPVDLLEEGDVERARAADIRLGVYAVKSEAQTRRALTRGVSAFTTDLPDIALKLRAEL